MGLFFSKIKRRHKTSREVLEELEHEISDLQGLETKNVYHHKSFVAYLLILSFVTYLIGAAVFYFYFVPSTWVDSINVLPLILFPFVIYGVKKLLNAYFAHKQEQYRLRLNELSAEKRKVLENIMDNEPYKTAVELLTRFDPQNPELKAKGREELRQRKKAKPEKPAPSDLQPGPTPSIPHPHPVPATPRLPFAMETPHPFSGPQVVAPSFHVPLTPILPLLQAPSTSSVCIAPELTNIPPGMALGSAPGTPQPHPLLPRHRSNFDKFVDFLVGDGPANRYALICSQCHSHNGMVLKDEFEYTTFRCAYCYALNPARKIKPSCQKPSSVAQEEAPSGLASPACRSSSSSSWLQPKGSIDASTQPTLSSASVNQLAQAVSADSSALSVAASPTSLLAKEASDVEELSSTEVNYRPDPELPASSEI